MEDLLRSGDTLKVFKSQGAIEALERLEAQIEQYDELARQARENA